MRVIAAKTLNAYRERYPEASAQLLAWKSLIESRDFKHLEDLKSIFGSADSIKMDRVVFNIKGNHFRLVAGVDFGRRCVFVKWFGTHKEYDKINPAEVVYADPSS